MATGLGSSSPFGVGGYEVMNNPQYMSAISSAVDPDKMEEMLDDPQYQGMMEQMLEDPDTLRQLMEENPMMKNMINNNPMMKNMLSNPAMLKMIFSTTFFTKTSRPWRRPRNTSRVAEPSLIYSNYNSSKIHSSLESEGPRILPITICSMETTTEMPIKASSFLILPSTQPSIQSEALEVSAFQARKRKLKSKEWWTRTSTRSSWKSCNRWVSRTRFATCRCWEKWRAMWTQLLKNYAQSDHCTFVSLIYTIIPYMTRAIPIIISKQVSVGTNYERLAIITIWTCLLVLVTSHKNLKVRLYFSQWFLNERL